MATVAMLSTNAHAAIEVDEQHAGPTYGTMMADILIAKPLQLAGAIAGTALHVIALPFSSASGSEEMTRRVLVDEPWEAMRRCVGCTESYDDYIKGQNANPNEVRFTIDGPAEVIINTEQNVVVNPY